MMKEREYRALQPLAIQEQNKRFDTDYYVEGYAAKYAPYTLWEDEDGPIYEQFDRNAFVGCDMTDIIMQYDHEGKVYARMRNNTLIVEADDTGLFVAADLSKSEASRQMYEEISNGLVDRMSWGFIPGEYNYDKKTRTITHTKVKKIFDVSAVSIPANDNTNIQARSVFNGEIRQLMQDMHRAEIERRKLILKIKLEGIENEQN